jgi:RNA polymerase sigma-70 factor (ECF subfamily)
MGIAERRSDAELIVAAGDDVAAFEELYRRHAERVLTYAAGRCATAEDVADVVAETFVRLLDVIDRYDPARGEPVAFLCGIAANAVRDVHRLRSRHRALVTRLGLAGRDLLDHDDIEQIDAAIDAARAAAGPVREAIEAVPSGERDVHCDQTYSERDIPLLPAHGDEALSIEGVLDFGTDDLVGDGTETVDGRDLVRLRLVSDEVDHVFLVDPTTHLPVQERITTAEGTTVGRYEYLPRTPANLAAAAAPPVPAGYTQVPPGTSTC